ncbi:hypothetical protein GHK92_14445 [Nocardioides sp. dk4132]|uniref:hypothetical protein n=1 Tax=Nocardioides sp. dk4132 TaxID=2662433 RepID=UPI001295887C|nr:hypothetical protein [Nocardioides sp. dk4132]MQW77077.1 hypothetical protein [Nocardioides sp. dk4132]
MCRQSNDPGTRKQHVLGKLLNDFELYATSPDTRLLQAASPLWRPVGSRNAHGPQSRDEALKPLIKVHGA